MDWCTNLNNHEEALKIIIKIDTLTSLNLTGLQAITDRGVSALLPLTSLARLSLACTAITDAALDYLTYYTRCPDAA